MGTVLQGWTMSRLGALEEGIAHMQHGVRMHRATGAELLTPYWSWLQAEAHGRAGRFEAGLTLLDEAIEAMTRSDERYWEAEVHRLRGQFLLAVGVSEEQVETAYRRALGIARA